MVSLFIGCPSCLLALGLLLFRFVSVVWRFSFWTSSMPYGPFVPLFVMLAPVIWLNCLVSIGSIRVYCLGDLPVFLQPQCLLASCLKRGDRVPFVPLFVMLALVIWLSCLVSIGSIRVYRLGDLPVFLQPQCVLASCLKRGDRVPFVHSMDCRFSFCLPGGFILISREDHHSWDHFQPYGVPKFRRLRPRLRPLLFWRKSDGNASYPSS